MNAEMLKGHLDNILLAAIGQGPAHGYAIIEAIRERSGGSFDLPEGTIYPALHRLELAGLVASDWVTPPGGRRRRVYTLTDTGAAALAERRGGWRRFAGAVDALLADKAVSGLIADYGATLERRLGFDPPLARRAREEVEAHLRDAAADAQDERAAIRRFGSADAVARGYAEAALPHRARSALMTSCLLVAATFLFMRLRSVWLFDDADVTIAPLATAIDRVGFGAGLLLCLVAWGALRAGETRRLPVLLIGAGAALGLSIAASFYRAGVALSQAVAPEMLVSVGVTALAEAVLLGIVAYRLRLFTHHAAIAGR